MEWNDLIDHAKNMPTFWNHRPNMLGKVCVMNDNNSTHHLFQALDGPNYSLSPVSVVPFYLHIYPGMVAL